MRNLPCFEVVMEFLCIEKIADKWGMSKRSVQLLCAGGRIEGAKKFGRSWMIPEDAKRPLDGRSREGRLGLEEDMPLPRKTPFLYMSDLYSETGVADDIGASLSYNHEARILFEAEVAYSRGEIDRVYESANYLLSKHSGFYAVISAGMLLAMCAIWKGDIEMWRKAKIHIAEAPAKSDTDRDVMLLAISAVDIMLYNVDNFPEWFKTGCFEPLPNDSLPAAKVYYAKYLYATAYAIATGAYKLEGVQGLSLMQMLPNTVEPLISWAKSSGTVIAEAYLRLTCAAIYHNCGKSERAINHIDRAIELTLPDGLYGLLAEYCRILGPLIESRLSPLDAEAWAKVNKLYKTYNEGWSRLSGIVRGKTLITTLTPKQREVAKLASFGMTNKEIAAALGMSVAGVKQALLAVTDKTGASRENFAAFL